MKIYENPLCRVALLAGDLEIRGDFGKKITIFGAFSLHLIQFRPNFS